MGCAASFQLAPCCCCCRSACCLSNRPDPETAEGRRRLLKDYVFETPNNLDRFNEYVELPNGQLMYTACWAPKANSKIIIKGLICIAEGYADCVDYMLCENFAKLSQLGYVVFSWDNLGQGKSDGLWNYVDNWPQFIDNAVYVIRNIAIGKYCKKYDIKSPNQCVLAGHSMGGAYSVELSKKMRNEFAGMILVAPMCRIDDNIRPADCVISLLKNCIMPCCPAANMTPTEDINEWVTSDPVVKKRVYDHPLLYDKKPRLLTGLQLYAATLDIDTNIDKITMPFLIMHGSGDKVTDPKFSQYFYDHTSGVPSDKKRIILYPDAWHMLFDEPQSKKQIYDDIDKWFQSLTESLEQKDYKEEETKDSKETLKVTVICGPSGVGKGTLLKILKERFPNAFGVSISHTTRDPRVGEINGQHYHFISKEEFQRLLKEKEFVEYAEVHGQYYGTSKKSLATVAAKKQICLLEIDINGAKQIKESELGNDAKFLFINMSGGIEKLRERLKSRKTETDEQVEKRMKTATIEIEFLEKNPNFFDKVLVNDDLEKSGNELCEVFVKWYPTLK